MSAGQPKQRSPLLRSACLTRYPCGSGLLEGTPPLGYWFLAPTRHRRRAHAPTQSWSGCSPLRHQDYCQGCVGLLCGQARGNGVKSGQCSGEDHRNSVWRYSHQSSPAVTTSNGNVAPKTPAGFAGSSGFGGCKRRFHNWPPGGAGGRPEGGICPFPQRKSSAATTAHLWLSA